MDQHQCCNGLVQTFASACERLNEYAQELRRIEKFQLVRTGADIRLYNNEWCLEKWIEASLDKSSGTWVAWWMQLSFAGGNWIVENHLSISHGELFVEFPEKRVSSIEELKQGLLDAVRELTTALEVNAEFSGEVMRRLEKSN